MKSDFHGHVAARIQVAAFNGDASSSGQRPGVGVDTGKIWRLLENRQRTGCQERLSETTMSIKNMFVIPVSPVIKTYHEGEGLG